MKRVKWEPFSDNYAKLYSCHVWEWMYPDLSVTISESNTGCKNKGFVFLIVCAYLYSF